ncbi:RagB/SusD family nutrient uptake outer membrane protein [Hymenobacter sp. J193]|uniref:RagB/SusD family nutrient uptake outer membrane protein n=1 Tax=Hymenobacter sp. J193 TaxID=2898429 RepID=UPI002150D5A7|nr:RagB/SusD family nutrient uptake outer membrane protein [Hymenobacter sp. J193]MCR5890913.1 RagB/SusD family nutrient uptake outer membrane protein [Hymenobacter sp. J193]MCR5890999.1 RagB/SusD family nutrient uptake outer membrane protein [Hymenobacter sp. J193]
MNRNFRYSLLLGLGLSMGLSSCQDLDIAPTDRPTDATFWTQPADAANVLATAYENLYNSEYFFFNEVLSDNAFNVSDVNGSNSRNIAQGAYGTNQQRITNEWGYHYTGIRKSNVLLAHIDEIPSIDAGLKARYIGEARALRAFHYFQLLTWYGDVPLVTTEIGVTEAQQVTRTPRAQVLDFVLKELDEAAAALPVNTAYAVADRGRFTKGAALALKARVLLYESRWAEVTTLTEQLMSGAVGTYSLFPSYTGVFAPSNEGNNEVMLDLQYLVPTRTHSEQRLFIPRTEGKLITAIAPTQELVNDYIMANGQAISEVGSGYSEETPYAGRDPRFGATIVHDGYVWRRPDGSTITIRTVPGTGDNSVDRSDASPTGYYSAKYFDPTADANLNSGLNLILIRYADVLLMHAEAKNEQNQLTAADWDRTIGVLRRRAGFTAAGALNFPAGSQESLRSIVRRERRTELAMEGLRIFDIRRWRTAETVLTGYVHGIKAGSSGVDNGYLRVDQRTFDPSRHYLWPVPQRERDINPNLSQNPGW